MGRGHAATQPATIEPPVPQYVKIADMWHQLAARNMRARFLPSDDEMALKAFRLLDDDETGKYRSRI